MSPRTVQIQLGRLLLWVSAVSMAAPLGWADQDAFEPEPSWAEPEPVVESKPLTPEDRGWAAIALECPGLQPSSMRSPPEKLIANHLRSFPGGRWTEQAELCLAVWRLEKTHRSLTLETYDALLKAPMPEVLRPFVERFRTEAIYSILHRCVVDDDVACVRALFTRPEGQRLDLSKEPLVGATTSATVARILIEQGADVDLPFRGSSPLTRACRAQDLVLIETLRELGASPVGDCP